MPIAAYPSTLPLPLSGHTREQPATFGFAQPRRGLGYVEPIGTAAPAFWSAKWRFSAAQAQAFRAWFVADIDRGRAPFTLSLRTEFGLVTQEVRFLPESLLPARHLGGGVWEYSATVMARALLLEAAADLILMEGSGYVLAEDGSFVPLE